MVIAETKPFCQCLSKPKVITFLYDLGANSKRHSCNVNFKLKTSITFAFVCFLHNPVVVLYRLNFSVDQYKVERVITGHACIACFLQDKKVSSYKGFNLIKVYFIVHYSACVCYQLFQC